MFGAVAGVEEAAFDGDEGVVERAVSALVLHYQGMSKRGAGTYDLRKPFPWP